MARSKSGRTHGCFYVGLYFLQYQSNGIRESVDYK